MPDLLPFLGEVALRSSLVLAAVFALLFMMRQASASERHFVLVLGLLVTTLIPIGLILSPKITWTISVPHQGESRIPRQIGTYRLPETQNPLPQISSPVMKSGPSWLDALTVADAVIVFLAGGMLAQCWMLGQAVRAWRRIRCQAAKALLPDEVLTNAQVFAGRRAIPPILVSDQISVPLLSGWLRPAIILPSAAAQWLPQRLSMVLCHELAHFRRGDSVLLPLICAGRVLYWWHPLVWLALARLRRERENACDDLVLNQNFRASDYAELIVDAARQAREFRWQNGALAMASTSSVGARIGAILNPKLNRRSASRRTILTGLLLAFGLGWLFVVVQVNAQEKPIAYGLTSSMNAAKPQIRLNFDLVEIDEKTYQQQTTAIDAAVKNGNVAFLTNLRGASVMCNDSVVTQAGVKANLTLGKDLILGDKSTPETTITATSVLGAGGKVVPTLVRSQSKGPLKTFLGVGLETTPSISRDGSILLPIRYRIGYVPGYQNPGDFYTRSTTTDTKWSVANGQASGFWASAEDTPGSKLYPYSLISILNSPGEEQIKTLPPLSPSPNRLAFIVHASRVGRGETTFVPKSPIDSNGKKPVKFHIVFVEVDEETYQRQAQAMNEAVANGNLHFFDNPRDSWILRSTDLVLLDGQNGWYSEGSVQSYVASAKQEMRDGKPWTTLQAKAVFLGLNADFSWSKDRLTMDSAWQVTEPVSDKPLDLEKAKVGVVDSLTGLPATQFHVASYTDKAWDMTLGKEHAFWVGETFGRLRNIPMSVNDKNHTLSRLAVFMTAQPEKN